MRACWLKWVGRDWSISADYIWLNYSGANSAVMCDQAETWSGSRYFSERKMAEMHDAAFRMGAAGEHDWAELEKAARKMIESSLELADSVEAA